MPMGWGKRTTRTNEDYNIFGRLRPGVTVAQAQADIDRIVSGMKQQYPNNYPPGSGFMISVVPLLDQVVRRSAPAAADPAGRGWLRVVDCLFQRGEPATGARRGQAKEIAVRAAVGAVRSRIARQLLTESVVLSLIGGLLGLVLAFVVTRLLRSFGPDTLPRLNEIGVDGRVLAFTFFRRAADGHRVRTGSCSARVARRLERRVEGQADGVPPAKAITGCAVSSSSSK